MPAASAAAVTPRSDPEHGRLQLQGDTDRAVGCLIGAMCGNALGAQVEPEKQYRLSRMFPHGVVDMTWSFDTSPSRLPPGHVTGDFATLTAVARSLVHVGRADTAHLLEELARTHGMLQGTPAAARCSPYTDISLQALAAGVNAPSD
jgi:ADP-ribosylglycohydrolase